MAVPIYRQGVCTGHIFMNDKERGGEFTQFDEDSLLVFAAQAGMVIANARTPSYIFTEPRVGYRMAAASGLTCDDLDSRVEPAQIARV